MKKVLFTLTWLCCSALGLMAQTDDALKQAAAEVPISDWSFGNTRYQLDDGSWYYLDTEHHLAQLYYLASGDDVPTELTVPDIVTSNDEKYVVVAYSGSYYNSNNPVRKLHLPSTLRYIMQYAFANYGSLTDIDIPASVEKIDGAAFYAWSNRNIHFLGTTPPEATGRLNSADDAPLNIYVPAKAFKEYVVADYIKDKLVLSDDWSVIGDVTVSDVDNGELGYIVVADALPEVRKYAEINRLTVTSGQLNSDDFYQIRQMPNLTYLDLSGVDIAEIPSQALRYCRNLKTVILPKTLTTIANQAFAYSGVKYITLPETFTTFTGTANFYDCDSLRTIVIPDSVKALPNECFSACDSLHYVTLPAALESMGSTCFASCDIYDIDIPGTLATIPYQAFSNNTNLSTVTFHEGLVYINYKAFISCKSITNLVFPSTTKYIGEQAFSSCSSLADIELNEGLETIYYYTFSSAALTEVTLPSSLISALYYPFSNCPITKIVANSLIPPTVNNMCVCNNPDNVELSVPLWSFQEYMTTPGWLEYQNHIKIITDNLPENVYINKDFEFVLRPEDDATDYHPNIRLMQNDQEIDDGFGHTKYERGNLTISSRSKLAVGQFSMYFSPYAKYYADYSRFYSSNNYTYDYYRTEYNPNTLIVRGEMRAEEQTINLMLYNNRWQFISFPFDVEMKDIVPTDPTTQWIVREYSGAERAAQNFDATWQDIPSDGTLKAGRGYIMMCYSKDRSNPEFTVTPLKNSLNRQKLFNSSDVQTALEEHESEFEQNRSWNLIGNPYPSFFDTRFIDTEAPFLIWDSYNRTYRAFSPVDDDYILNPGEAFFIQRPTSGGETLRFMNGGRQTYRNPSDLKVSDVKREQGRTIRSDRHVYNITLTDGDMADRTRIVFNPEAKPTYETARDAAKMKAMNADMPQLWSEAAGVQYAINERPATTDAISLTVSVAHAGDYTFSLAENSAAGTILLTDTKTGITTNLATSDYTFSSTAGTINDRFLLNITSEDATAISYPITSEDRESASDAATYNLTGQRVDGNYRGIVIKNGKKSAQNK